MKSERFGTSTRFSNDGYKHLHYQEAFGRMLSTEEANEDLNY